MKTIRWIVFGMVMILAIGVQSQVSFNINIGAPPPWGPAGYSQVRYYYLPDVEAYYDVQSSMFIYYGGGAWVRRTYLPAQYKNYDLYHGYKVVMTDYHGQTPYSHFKEHKQKYGKGYHGKAQRTVGEYPGEHHGNKDSGHDNGDRNAHNKDNNDSHGKNNKDNHGHGDGNGKKK
jgi:hypothetical protein